MLGLFGKKNKSRLHDSSCRCIRPCELTNTILAHLNAFLDRYYQETGIHIQVEFCDDESMIHAAHSFDLPLDGANGEVKTKLEAWIHQYLAGSEMVALPADIDAYSSDFLIGYESDDSYQALFEQVRDTYLEQGNLIRLAFAVSPWSEEFGCENCVRIFW